MDGIEQLQALIQKLHIALLPVCLFIVSLPFHILEKEKESVSITSSKGWERKRVCLDNFFQGWRGSKILTRYFSFLLLSSPRKKGVKLMLRDLFLTYFQRSSG